MLEKEKHFAAVAFFDSAWNSREKETKRTTIPEKAALKRKIPPSFI